MIGPSGFMQAPQAQPAREEDATDFILVTESKPPKGITVRAYWRGMDRCADSEWTGKRWLRFNELFGGWDPIEDVPTKWKFKRHIV